eukprot:8669576-Pyramimonas_sp.AAC.1
MDKKNSKGVTPRKVLMNAISTKSYYYLRNNSVFAHFSRGQLIAQGTPQNEAEHRTLKRWAWCVWQQHEDRVHVLKE